MRKGPLVKERMQQLAESLHYLLMTELKAVCRTLDLPLNGKKGEVIQRILLFLKSGDVLKDPKIPKSSRAKKGREYFLAPNTRILYGAYKNDERTRSFMKTLVGDHFHFTAFGQDWIRERWMESNPPTYQEFAEYWEREYRERKKRKASPKQEWAYLNFIQKYGCSEDSSEIRAERWKKERNRHKKIVESIVKTFLEGFRFD